MFKFLDKVREDFVGYTSVTGDTTGEHIAEAINTRLQALDLDPLNLRAQSYDVTGNCFISPENIVHIKTSYSVCSKVYKK